MPESSIPALSPTENNSVSTPSYSGAALEWLSALPNEPTRADLTAIDPDLAISCIHALVENDRFERAVQSNFPAGEWLNHFYFEVRNREKVFGTKNLGIGYPYVLARLGGYEVAAPLFVWQFQLEPHAQHVDEWLVQRNDSHLILPNYPFFHLLDALNGTDFSRRARQLSEGNALNNKNFDDLCEGVRLMLGLVEDGLPLSIQPFPSNGTAKTHITEGRLLWSAVAGVFPTLPRTTVTHPPAVAPDLTADGADWKHTFTMLPLDPSQRSVLHAMQHNALTVVEGASGTGKTYLISAIVMNALSHGKKCLVVSKSINALRRSQKFLLEKGFGDVSFVIRDIGGDQLMLADMLRMASENKNKALYNEELFKTVLNKTQREQRKLDDAWEELHTPLLAN
ncbi:MAG: PhoH family protein [Lewinellaceae bacterium]|nr:PhoH family protein [Lewinellaceae bacterium]